MSTFNKIELTHIMKQMGRSYVLFKESDKYPISITIHSVTNCTLDGNLLNDGVNIELDSLIQRNDAIVFGKRPHLLRNKVRNSTKRIKLGFVLRSLRDNNYQMFFVDTIPKFWYLQRIDEIYDNLDISIIIRGTNGGCSRWIKNNECLKSGYMKETIEHLSKSLRNNVTVIEHNESIHFDRLLIPMHLSSNFTNYFPKLSPPIYTVFESLTSVMKTQLNELQTSPEYIYISRKDRMDGQQRHMQNKNDFLKIVTKYGFKEIIASKYNLKQKYDLFLNVKVAIIEGGAGMTNVAFFPKNTLIIMIYTDSKGRKIDNVYTKDWFNLWFDNHLYHLNLRLVVFDDVKKLSNHHNSPFNVDLDNFENLLSQNL